MAHGAMTSLALQLHCTLSSGFSLTADVDLPDQGVTAIYGPSGSGKTTLLECISGLRRGGGESLIRYREEIWEGPDQFVPPWQRRIGFVFQNARLFPHLTAGQNLDYGQRRRHEPGQVSREQVIAWLELAPLLNRSPASLSAGQRQRVAIGRALLCSPQLLLLDEPLANLDHRARDQCLMYLQTLQAQLKLPMIYVSHDIGEVSQLADHLLLLEQGDVAAQGPLLDLCGRLDTRLAHAEQAAAILSGTIKRHDPDFGLTELDVEAETVYVNQLAGQIGHRQRLRIPARDVSVCRERPQSSSILNILPVQLTAIEASGEARMLLQLSLGDQHLLARITRKSAAELGLQVGDNLYAQIKSAPLLSDSAVR